MLIRISFILLVLTVAIAAFVFVRSSQEDADNTPRYTGAHRCQVCHESASSGQAFRIWLNGPHARAFATLSSTEARNYIRQHGDSMASCLKCHSTLGRAARNEAEKSLLAEGVGCERCHGAGSDYAYYDHMRDHPAFLANGGVGGSLDDCQQCHSTDLKSDQPHCPFQLADFKPDTAWKLIRHPHPEIDKPDTVLELR